MKVREIGLITKWVPCRWKPQYGFIRWTAGIDVYTNEAMLVFNKSKMSKDLLVSFCLRTGKGVNKLEAVEVQLLSEEQDLGALEWCFESGDQTLLLNTLHSYLSRLSLDRALGVAKGKIARLPEPLKPRFAEKIPCTLLALQDARPLRQYLSIARRIELYQSTKGHCDLAEETAEAVLSDEGRTGRCLAYDSFWTEIGREAPYGGKLFSLVPEATRNRIVLRHFKNSYEIIQGCIALPRYLVAWNPRNECATIAEADQQLAERWIRGESQSTNHEYVQAKMLSARIAEKIAIKFYSQFGHYMEDLSGQQLDNTSLDWRFADLRLDGIKSVDVKNARNVLSNNKFYSDHCIPRFKEHRGGQVTIAGVLSPYLTLNRLLGSASIDHDTREILFLGETGQTEIRALEALFGEGKITVQVTSQAVVPPWVFDYPLEFYSLQEQNREHLRRMNPDELPPRLACELAKVNPIPAALSAGLSLPDFWSDTLSPWQKDFYRQLLPKNGERITLPRLFLSLLTHFIGMAARKAVHDDYHPDGYERLLFASSSSPLPLGIRDPLSIVWDFLATLKRLWDHRESTQLCEFQSYRFYGLGLLRGIRHGATNAETILAYCGGFMDQKGKKGKCGFSPLVLGQHVTCSSCRKLVCPNCGYCSSPCSDQNTPPQELSGKFV